MWRKQYVSIMAWCHPSFRNKSLVGFHFLKNNIVIVKHCFLRMQSIFWTMIEFFNNFIHCHSENEFLNLFCILAIHNFWNNNAIFLYVTLAIHIFYMFLVCAILYLVVHLQRQGPRPYHVCTYALGGEVGLYLGTRYRRALGSYILPVGLGSLWLVP